MTASRPGQLLVYASLVKEDGCAWWTVKHLQHGVYVVQEIVGGWRSLVWYSRNTFRNPYSGAHTLRSRCNVCKKWLMAGGGARGLACCLVGRQRVLAALHGAVLRWVGRRYGTGQRDGGWSGGRVNKMD